MEPWIRNTRLVSQWREMKDAVEVHKWCESEKLGHDIGWSRAFTSWLIRSESKPDGDDRQQP